MSIKKRIAAFLLTALVLGSCLAPGVSAASDRYDALIDASELDELIDDYIVRHRLTNAEIGVGLCYLDSGEEYYYNPDVWIYSASLYKVPLMMIYAERVYDGEMTFDDYVGSRTLDTAMRYILIQSNNDYSSTAMDQLGSPRLVRDLYKDYAPELDEDYYDDGFCGDSMFTPRFMTNVMMTLYYESERFPRVKDYLLISQPDAYFRETLGDDYEIAQKYGSWYENNHATAIIYTPHPIVVTVMTRNMGCLPTIIGEIGEIVADYAMSLDDEYEARLLAAPKEDGETESDAAEALIPQKADVPPVVSLRDSDTFIPAAIVALCALGVIAVLLLRSAYSSSPEDYQHYIRVVKRLWRKIRKHK